MTRPRGARDLAILAAGLGVSTAGDYGALVALLLRVRPEGSGWVAALLAAEIVPVVVLASVAGALVDRVESRRVLICALLAQGVIAVPLALVTPAWATVALFAALSAVSTVVRPATASLVPAITGVDDASRGYARIATGSGLGLILGPVGGGLLTGVFGVRTAVLVDAGTFVALAGATALLRVRRPPGRTGRPEQATGGGFALLWRTPAIRVPLLVSAVAVGCAVIDNVASPFRFVDQLGTSSTGYGLYLTIWSAGALLGVQVVGRLGSRHATAIALGNLLVGVGIAGIGLAPTVVLALVAAGIGGVGNGFTNVAQNALLVTNTPQSQHGRALAAAAAVDRTAIGVGTATGPPLIALVRANGAMIAAGGLCVLVSAAGLLARGGLRTATGSGRGAPLPPSSAA